MTSPDNNFSFSEWMSYPTGAEGLLNARVVVPVPVGIYGMLSSQLLITSNHQPSLVCIGKILDVTSLVLDGGGFPIEVATAFGFLSQSQIDQILANQPEIKNGSITLLVPQSLAVAWKWKSGETHLGCAVRIISDSPSNIDVSPSNNIPPLIVRLFTGLRLALVQALLMALPVWIIYPMALAWVIPLLFFAACLLSGFWPTLPGNGWVKGLILGILGASMSVIPMALHLGRATISAPPLLPLGIFLAFLWMGGVLMGARTLNS